MLLCYREQSNPQENPCYPEGELTGVQRSQGLEEPGARLPLGTRILTTLDLMFKMGF